MERNKEIYKVTLLGGAVNVVLLVFKFVAGIAGHSAAMVADAVHSLSDGNNGRFDVTACGGRGHLV